MRLNKNITIFINYFLGPSLFLWLCYSIYHQIQQQPNLAISWLHAKNALGTTKIFYLAGACLLMLLNWGLEAVKWKIAVAVMHPISFIQSFKAVLSGVSFSVTTPNRVGEYLGRMMYMPEGKRLKIIAITLIASFSQILITLFVGLIGFIVLKSYLTEAQLISTVWHRFIAAGLALSVSILTLLYFSLPRLENWLEGLLKHSRHLYLIQAVHLFHVQRLLALMLLSLTRYAVFAIQYVLVFRLFGVDVPVGTLFWVMSLVFLALAIIPSITLIEIGIRGEVCLQLVGLFTLNSLGILLTSLSVWFINLMIPAFAGSLLILGIKIFKRRDNEMHRERDKYHSDEMV